MSIHWGGRGPGHISRRTSAGFSPASLFANGEQGIWLDPSDLSTVFQDAAGTTPGAVGSVVGLIRDKSGRGNHASQATAASKPILRQNATTRALYLEFDGVDDFLATAAIDLTATDEVTVFAGVRKLSDAAQASLVELSGNFGANSGTFLLSAPVTGASSNYTLQSRGTATATASYSNAVIAAPVSSVLTGQAKIATDQCLLRVNGTQQATSATDQGTGNYGNFPLYIGRRGGISLPFNGHLYGLTSISRLATAAEIASNEAWLNGKVGAY